MLRRLRSKLTYANVVASLALFIALGGSAYAIGAGTIGSREVRDNSLRARDIDERGLRARPRVYRRTSAIGVQRGASRSHRVDCTGGDVAIGGGVNAVGDLQDPGLQQLYGAPGKNGRSFVGVIRYGANGIASSFGVQLYVTCAQRPRR